MACHLLVASGVSWNCSNDVLVKVQNFSDESCALSDSTFKASNRLSGGVSANKHMENNAEAHTISEVVP